MDTLIGGQQQGAAGPASQAVLADGVIAAVIACDDAIAAADRLALARLPGMSPCRRVSQDVRHHLIIPYRPPGSAQARAVLRSRMRRHYTFRMTASRALPRQEMCAQHRQPKSDCEPWDRHGHTMRFREDLWVQADLAAQAGKSDVTTLLTETLEVMLGHIRCHRCSVAADPVPVTLGDLSGRPLREWVADAARQVQRQHPRHEPVRAGEAPLIRADALCLRCDAPWSADHVCEDGAEPPAPVVFMEPDHGTGKGRAAR
jgi:hypothetical protein